MEFYQISQSASGRYELIEEDATREKAALSQGQLGIIADRLSALYDKQHELPLRIRTYLTAYYSNGLTEYISVQSTPSLLLGEMRLQHKYGADVILDGFALTFLEGEEENRVWLGEDGVVENRGNSTEKVRQLLDILIASLDHPTVQRIALAQERCSNIALKRALADRKWLDTAQAQGWLDRNQEEIFWYDTMVADKRQSQSFVDDDISLPEEGYLPLLATGAHYELAWRAKDITLYEYCYAWRSPTLPEALWQYIVQTIGEKE